ncbi:MAG: flagellar biosynthetic protein FliR [Clostridiales bacterium]|nr:flagellar biosynthetic protein FliR [Clostridiales bacterium]
MTLSLDFAFRQLSAYILVFCRMTGVVLFNPLLSRKNIPTQFSLALCLGLAILIAPGIAETMGPIEQDIYLVGALGAELLIGFVWGLIFQIFYYLLFMAGDAIDLGLGLSMAKVFDRNTNIQMSLSGNLFNMMFVLYLFASNSHLALIRLAASSYAIIGPGGAVMDIRLSGFMVDLFLQTMSLVIRLCLPFLAATFTVEITMGVLMKLVPQINVFSIHFQAKVIMGLLLLFIFTIPVAGFVDHYLINMLQQMENALGLMGGSPL